MESPALGHETPAPSRRTEAWLLWAVAAVVLALGVAALVGAGRARRKSSFAAYNEIGEADVALGSQGIGDQNQRIFDRV